jgi:hypothetical protein
MALYKCAVLVKIKNIAMRTLLVKSYRTGEVVANVEI